MSRLFEAPFRGLQISLSRKPHYSHSRYVAPPPSTPEGYSLQLIGNLPAQVLPKREFKKAQKRIDTFREKLNGKGAWDNYKVNVVSAREITVFDDTGKHQVIQYETAPTTYFQHRAAITKNMPYLEARMLTHSGVGAVVITGDNKIILSTRPDNCNLYPRTVTVTASGSWEGTPQTPIMKHPNGATKHDALPPLVPPTPRNALENMQTELHEETGLPLSTILSPQTKTTMLGIAEDSLKKHWDLLYMVELPQDITQDRLHSLHHQAKKNALNNNDPMAGHFIFIDATPQKIEEYLTQLNTFWDGNADRALLATGKILFMRKEIANGISPEKANEHATAWMDMVSSKVKLTRQERNQQVKTYRREHIRESRKDLRKARRDVVFHVFDTEQRQVAQYKRREARKIHDAYKAMNKGYDPHLEPEKQGGLGVKQALIAMGHPLD